MSVPGPTAGAGIAGAGIAGAETAGSSRRRRRADRPHPPVAQPAPAPVATPAAPSAAEHAPEATPRSPEARPRRRGADHAERGLRELVGGGKSQLGVSGALRGRDVNRPTHADLAAAERDVVIIRRHWTPPA